MVDVAVHEQGEEGEPEQRERQHQVPVVDLRLSAGGGGHRQRGTGREDTVVRQAEGQPARIDPID